MHQTRHGVSYLFGFLHLHVAYQHSFIRNAWGGLGTICTLSFNMVDVSDRAEQKLDPASGKILAHQLNASDSTPLN